MLQLFRPKYEVEACLAEIRKSLESGWTGPGPKCTEFEKKWSAFTASNYSHYVNSATAALHIALRLCDLPPGSKVATTGLTFVSTNAVILYENCVPVFCDTNLQDMSLSYDSAIKAVEGGCSAIIWVHYGGNVSNDFYRFLEEIEKRKLDIKIIEDCAHAGGAFYHNRKRVGSLKNTISCFSFQAVKNLPTFDSGMICLSNEDQYQRATRLSWLGIDKNTYARTNVGGANEIYKWIYSVPELGWKYNANDIAASVALVQLKYLDRDNAYRQQLYNWYLEELKDYVTIMKHENGSSHHLMVIRSEKRDQIMAALKANNYAPGVHYLPNFEFPVFSKFYDGACPNSERAAKELLSLPNHLEVTHEDVINICKIIKELA